MRAVQVLLSVLLSTGAALAQSNIGPIATPRINNVFYAGSQLYPTVQSAVTAACGLQTGATVVRNFGAVTNDTPANAVGCASVSIVDGSAVMPIYYNWVGGFYVLSPPTFTSVFATGPIVTSNNVPALPNAGTGASAAGMSWNFSNGAGEEDFFNEGATPYFDTARFYKNSATGYGMQGRIDGAGNYIATGGFFGTTINTASGLISTLNSVQYLTLQAGADVAAPLNAAMALCPSNGCAIHISPVANLTLNNPVVFPAAKTGIKVVCDAPTVVRATTNADMFDVLYGSDRAEIAGCTLSNGGLSALHNIILSGASYGRFHDLVLQDGRPAIDYAGLGIRLASDNLVHVLEGNEIYNISGSMSFIAITLSTFVNNTDIHDVNLQGGTAASGVTQGECFDLNGDSGATVGTKISNLTCQNTYGGNYVESAQSTSIVNSHFYNCGAGGRDCFFHHIGGASRPYRTLMVNDEFLGGQGSAISIFGVSTDISISNSRFENMGLDGIRIDAHAGGTNQFITITGSQFKGNGASATAGNTCDIGLRAAGGTASPVANLLVADNIFVKGPQTSAVCSDAAVAPYQLTVRGNDVATYGAGAFSLPGGCNGCMLGGNNQGDGVEYLLGGLSVAGNATFAGSTTFAGGVTLPGGIQGGLSVSGLPSLSGQGFAVGWNYSNGQGETDFFNNHGQGSGSGYRFYEADGGATPTLAPIQVSSVNSGNYAVNGAALASTNLSDSASLARLSSSITGTSAGITGINPVANGGTGAPNAPAALVNLGALPLAGGTMTGPIVLSANPTTGAQAANKTYVDAGNATNASSAAAAQTTANAALPLAGGTMTGLPTLPSTTPSGLQAASATYVATQIAPVATTANSAVQPGSSPSLAALTTTGGGGVGSAGPLVTTFNANAVANLPSSGTSKGGGGLAWNASAGQAEVDLFNMNIGGDTFDCWKNTAGGYIQTCRFDGIGNYFALGSLNAATALNGATANVSGVAAVGSIAAGHVANTVGLQLVTATACPMTATAAGQSCNTTVTLAVAEADTLYVPACSLVGGGYATLGNYINLTTTSFIVPTFALTASGTSSGTVRCQVAHN